MSGKELYKRFSNLLDSMGITKKDFCVKTGIRQSALSNWNTRGTMPSADLALTIANSLGVSVDYILGNSDIAFPDVVNQYTQEESDLIETYRSLDEDSKRQLVLMMAFLKSQQDKK